MRRVIGLIISVVVAVAVLVLDPMGRWEDRVPEPIVYTFTEAEMRNAVEGTWSLVVRDKKQHTTRTLKFAVVQAFRDIEPITFHRPADRGLIRSAAACNKRTLVRSAAACGIQTKMPLQIVVHDENVPIRSELLVLGADWEYGVFDLWIGDDLHVSATVAQDGGVIHPRGYGYRREKSITWFTTDDDDIAVELTRMQASR